MRPRFGEFPDDDDEVQLLVSFHSCFEYLMGLTSQTEHV